MVGYVRKRFLLYPEIEIANFMQTDRGNSNAHSVVYVCTAHAVPSLHILHSVGILFLNSFLQGVWRCPISMSGTKSHASLVPFSYRFDIMLNYHIYMNMENAIVCKNVDYQPPQVEIIEVEVEKGFTASNPYAIETVGVEQQEW